MAQNLDLIGHGFLKDENGHFFFADMQLSALLTLLNCSLADLKITPGQSMRSDVRLIERRGYIFIVRSNVRDSDGEVIPESLAFEDATCSVTAIPRE